MPSIWEQITSNPETYIDGYGTERQVYEPGFIRLARRVYNAADNFLNGSSDDEYMQYGIRKPVGGLGPLADITDVSALAKLGKELEAAEQIAKAPKRLRQRISKGNTPRTGERVFFETKKAEEIAPEISKADEKVKRLQDYRMRAVQKWNTAMNKGTTKEVQDWRTEIDYIDGLLERLSKPSYKKIGGKLRRKSSA